MKTYPEVKDRYFDDSDKRWKRILDNEYTFEEIKEHNTQKSCWIIVKKKIYNATHYLGWHPGGVEIIFRRGGMDATDDFFYREHSPNAKRILE
jgi:cytochrome b involved in lipid metabolism